MINASYTKRANTKILQAVLFVVVCALIILARSATSHALSSSWTASSGNWGTASNWDTSSPPNDSSDIAVFSLAGGHTINVNGTFDVGSLEFPTFGSSNYEFIGSGQLNLYNSITVNSPDVSINTHIVLQNDVTFNISSFGSLMLSGVNVLSGDHGITLTGGGGVYNNGTSTYSGTTNIEAGYFGSGDNNVWSPNSDFVLSDDGELSACGGNQTIASLSGTAGSNMEFCGARVTLGNASDTTYAGVMQDGGNPWGGITKVGTGKFTLTGTIANTGDTIVDEGILDVNGTITSSALTVNSGGTLKGSGILKSVTVNGTVAPGNSIGTLTGDSFEFTNGSTLENEINPNGTTDLINANSSVTIDPGAQLKIIPQAGTYTAGKTYTIISAPSITGTFSSVTGSINGLSYQIKYYPTHVDLVISPVGGGSTATVNADDPKAPSTGYGTPTKLNSAIILLATSTALIVTGLVIRTRLHYV